jgi:hypothetical protein
LAVLPGSNFVSDFRSGSCTLRMTPGHQTQTDFRVPRPLAPRSLATIRQSRSR